MIDIENEVISLVTDVLFANNISASVESVLNLNPSSFPTVCVEEIENASANNTADSLTNENHASVGYEINVFANSVSGKKADAKKILSVIDDALISRGFTRASKTSLSLDNATKYRIIARYRAYVSKEKTIFRRWLYV